MVASDSLRTALRRELAARGITLYRLARDRDWSRSREVTVSRWLRGAKDPRTGRPFRLPFPLRLLVAAEVHFSGPVLTPGEALELGRLFGASGWEPAIPSSSRSSSPVWRKEIRKKKKKKSRRGGRDPIEST